MHLAADLLASLGRRAFRTPMGRIRLSKAVDVRARWRKVFHAVEVPVLRSTVTTVFDSRRTLLDRRRVAPRCIGSANNSTAFCHAPRNTETRSSAFRHPSDASAYRTTRAAAERVATPPRRFLRSRAARELKPTPDVRAARRGPQRLKISRDGDWTKRLVERTTRGRR